MRYRIKLATGYIVSLIGFSGAQDKCKVAARANMNTRVQDIQYISHILYIRAHREYNKSEQRI
jgi:hypothetical protein